MKTEDNDINNQKLTIGIVSLYGWLKIWDNYGTLLQNFALQTFLQKNGHQTFWIRTKPTASIQHPLKYFILKIKDSCRAILRSLATPILGTARSKKLAAFNARHPRHFREFMSRHTPTSRREYTLEEITNEPPEADALIVGSDQIWRDVSRINFLDFGSTQIKRVAYGVSAPWPALDDNWYQSASNFIPQINSIAVRELEGLKVCEKLGRNDAIHVLDPVLLHDAEHYLDVIRQDNELKDFDSPFILGYFVNVQDLDQIPWESTVGLASNQGSELLAVPMQGAELVIPEKYIYVPTPCGWLNAFHKAECVVTNSYHGALFAIIMEKPFLVFLQGGVNSHQNGRFTSALKPLGLEDRMLTLEVWKDATVSDLEIKMSQPIAWEGVSEKLKALRKISTDYLEMALRD